MKKVAYLFWFVSLVLSFASCKNGSSKAKDSPVAAQDTNNHPTVSEPVTTAQDSIPPTSTVANDTGNALRNAVNNLLSQMNNGKDSGFNPMLSSLQSNLNGKSADPGNAIGGAILNFQLSKMNDNNPLKQVAQSMLKAERDGTRGPDKSYTAEYKAEQPDNYSIPLTGNGKQLQLQYTGGLNEKGKRTGMWKNITLSMEQGAEWNIYTESYSQSAINNLSAHSEILANINRPYDVELNTQYKKYWKNSNDSGGKYESNISVVKVGAENLFNHNCIHIKLYYTVKLESLHSVSNFEDDEWYCNDLPGAEFLSPEIFETSHSTETVQKIEKLGCKGVLIKAITQSGSSSSLMQLTAIQHVNVPAALFAIPVDFKEDENTALYGLQ